MMRLDGTFEVVEVQGHTRGHTPLRPEEASWLVAESNLRSLHTLKAADAAQCEFSANSHPAKFVITASLQIQNKLK